MKILKSLKNQIGTLILLSLFSAVFSSQAALAAESLNLKYLKSIKIIQFSKNLKIRGFQLSEGVYLGQAKVAGKYGFGVVMNRKKLSWGINNRGISIQKSF